MTAPLLAKIAVGDSAAVTDFLRQHAAMVWGLARRFCRTAEDAEDATQEIFVEVWRSANRYDSAVGSELTFLMTIARRRLIDRVRRTGRRPSTEQLDESVVSTPPGGDPVEFSDEVQRARAAMSRLAPDERHVLDLALGYGRTHIEIAAAVGLPLGTVKSHARRGLIKLRELLGIEAPKPPGDA